MTDQWGSDVPVSMPMPLEGEPLVQMFGFVFTEFGLFHDLSAADHETISTPTFAPYSPIDVVYDDEDIEVNGNG
jgi:hypothetical protein